jgi:predicted  nucleic acid-binding Zn-ribbon protein
MADTTAVLLDLWTIDQRRRQLRQGRDGLGAVLAKAQAEHQKAEATAQAAQAEADKMDALIRQYTADAARCDTLIAEARSKQGAAKTNKEYMDIINGIEHAKAEKAMREQSVKEITAKKAALLEKAQQAATVAAAAKAKVDEAQAKFAAAGGASPEEQELDARYAEARTRLDPEFLAVYEKLVKSGHKSPLVRVDPRTRSTPFGALLSHNQVEHIRQGKLVVDRNTNGILYIG